MPLRQTVVDLSIALGVLAGVAVVMAIFQIITWNRRQGKLVVDFITILRFVFYCVGGLGNAFFAVSLGFSLWWFILYKVRFGRGGQNETGHSDFQDVQ